MSKIKTFKSENHSGGFCPVKFALENVSTIIERQAMDIAIYKKTLYAISEHKDTDKIRDVLKIANIPFSLSTSPAETFLENLILDLEISKKEEDHS